MNKAIPAAPRYDRSTRIAFELLKRFNVPQLPVNPFDIIANIEKIALKPYSEVAAHMGFELQELIDGFGSPDGHAQMKPSGKPYIIYYNDMVPVKERINWTLAHELGHIALGHLNDFPELDFCRKGLTDEEYLVLEREADCFAGSLLSPLIVLKEIGIENKNQIRSLCNLSDEAAAIRFENCKKYAARKSFRKEEVEILEHFRPYLERKEYYRHLGRYHCPVCLGYFDGISTYCRICGTRTYEKIVDWRRTMRFFDSAAPGNQCSEANCSRPLQDDARYCGKCGSESTHFLNGMLSAWHFVTSAVS